MFPFIFLLTFCCLNAIAHAEDQYVDFLNNCNQDQVLLQPNYASPPIQQPVVFQQPPVQQIIPSPVETFEYPVQQFPEQQPLPVSSFNPQQLVAFRQQTFSGPQNTVFYVVPVPYPLREKKPTSNEHSQENTHDHTDHTNHRKPDPEGTDPDEKPNQCPPEESGRRNDCFRTIPYRGCENDSDCEGAHKCCFDACLEQLVCKPPIRS